MAPLHLIYHFRHGLLGPKSHEKRDLTLMRASTKVKMWRLNSRRSHMESHRRNDVVAGEDRIHESLLDHQHIALSL